MDPAYTTGLLRGDMSVQFGMVWSQIKAPLIVPLLRLAVLLCLVMSLMLFIERVYMAVVIVLVKLFGRKPEKRYKWEPMKDDVELGNSAYPMVLVQIPMYNEKEVPFMAAASIIITAFMNDITEPNRAEQPFLSSVSFDCSRNSHWILIFICSSSSSSSS